jgi:3-methyladenine DNA glycosylase AlkD
MSVIQELNLHKNPKQAKLLAGFFKAGPGEYGEGDKFLGIMVPQQRQIAQKYVGLSFPEIQKLLNNEYHEARLVGLLILTYKYAKADLPAQAGQPTRKRIFQFYLKNWRAINNWDLVDVTTPKIVGAYLRDKDKAVLYEFVKSKNLWKRRIAVLATFAFINQNQFADSLKLAKILLHDEHDLIHKAVGWMLREVGKRDLAVEETFLKKHYKTMPRTMLRYAIEKFPETKRLKYLKGRV